MRKRILIAAYSFASFVVVAQHEGVEPPLRLSGFVKTDVFYDTRQSVTAREGHFLLWPEPLKHDPDGKDIYASPSFNILSIQTRITGRITGPDAFGAKSSGVVEADFFGNENSSFQDLNGLRLRHAFLKLNWAKGELLVGQFWHPFFIPESFPGVISFNTGVPFQPFSRSPQIRYTQRISNLKVLAVIQSQRDFASRYGSPVVVGSKYLRNSALPDVQAQVQYVWGETLLTGTGAGYKILVPQLATPQSYKTSEAVSSVAAMAFVRLKLNAITIKTQGVYAQNGCDYMLPGGFAVKDTIDALRGIVNYTPIAVFTGWLDVSTNGKKFQGGLFAGFAKNLGSADDRITNGAIYGLGTDIAHLYRLSPRLLFIADKVTMAIELEHTRAAFGTPDKRAIPKEVTETKNTRVLVSAIYNF